MCHSDVVGISCGFASVFFGLGFGVASVMLWCGQCYAQA